jgi:SAM-dependent methyltransferase
MLPIVRARRALRTWPVIKSALDDPELLNRFAAGMSLPYGYGVGFNERVVEYPWLFACRPSGAILDAGSALNHKPILRRLLGQSTQLHIVTLAPERRSFTELGVSYLYADLRELPYRNGLFDAVVSISTLEHVGMDNTRYGATGAAAEDPPAACRRALGELVRMVRPGGSLFLTVPYGRPDNLGWSRVFGREDVEQLTSAGDATVVVFRYETDGWNHSTLEEAADAVYRERARDPHPADLAVTARAVACIELRTPTPAGVN